MSESAASKNNFGFLRLIFASMVIIGHAPEQIDGNSSHEPLTMAFHTVTLGGTGVIGFFLISGYLITKSALTADSLRRYFSNRVRRIVPGYAVAYLLCVFALAPLVGGAPWAHLGKIAENAALLGSPPDFPGALSGVPYPALNGSMWTIAHEFRCYVLIAVLLGLGLLQRRSIMLVLTAVLLVASVALFWADPHGVLDARTQKAWVLVGKPSQALRLISTFLVGSCVYLYWPSLKDRLTGQAALGATVLLGFALLVAPLANAASAVLGGAVLFWLALKARLGPLQQINDRWDVSYGVYLYGWPIAVTLLYFDRSINAWALASATLMISMGFGAASWFMVEKPLRRRPGAGRVSMGPGPDVLDSVRGSRAVGP